MDARAEIWKKMRQQGKRTYLLHRVRTGLIIAVVVSLVREFSRYGLVLDNLLTPRFLQSLLIGLLSFPLVFYLLGLWHWHRNEKKYGYDEEEDT